MASTDDVPQPAPSGGGPPSNRGNGPPLAPGSADDPNPHNNFATFGHYQLLEKIGETEIHVFYKARHRLLDRLVTIQMLKVPLLGNANERFARCVLPPAVLRHPYILPVFEIDQHQDITYVSMAYVQGLTLAQIGFGKPLPAARAVGYVMKLAHAVDYAHENGVLHLHLKPSNVIVDEHDQPYLFGFQSRLFFDAIDPATIVALSPEPPAYQSPERVLQKQGLGRESDVYSLGAILYELLTGSGPFSGGSLQESFRKVVTEEPPSPRQLNPDVPRDLETICLKCLEKDPQRRYRTAAALADDLGRFLSQKPIVARPVGRIEKARRWLRRQRSMIANRQS
jgi:eukaryotic-like serine/threonine-protein kinase